AAARGSIGQFTARRWRGCDGDADLGGRHRLAVGRLRIRQLEKCPRPSTGGLATDSLGGGRVVRDGLEDHRSTPNAATSFSRWPPKAASRVLRGFTER